MQAAFQKYTDNAVSKTVNLCHDATREDVRGVFMLACKTGCKGVTIYRDGSREAQVLNIGKVNKTNSGNDQETAVQNQDAGAHTQDAASKEQEAAERAQVREIAAQAQAQAQSRATKVQERTIHAHDIEDRLKENFDPAQKNRCRHRTAKFRNRKMTY